MSARTAAVTGVAVGVDLGGTKLLAALVDEAGTVVEDVKIARPTTGAGTVDAIAEIVGGWGTSLPVGMGVAGLVDRQGVLRVGPNLPGFVDFPFRDALAERIGTTVVVDNDATAATWGEFCVGAARAARDAVLVTLGTGIGGGVVAGGVLQRGANGFAGEPGHTVVDPNGPACPCGRRGCWERFASGSGLGRLAREAAEAGRAPGIVEAAGGDDSQVRGEHVTIAASSGDAGAIAVLWDFAWWVALGVTNLINVLDPEVVVIGGGLAEMGELLLAPVNERYRDLVLAGEHRPVVPIVAAELGEHAGAVGAGLLALDELRRSGSPPTGG
jgi:glucokinase